MQKIAEKEVERLDALAKEKEARGDRDFFKNALDEIQMNPPIREVPVYITIPPPTPSPMTTETVEQLRVSSGNSPPTPPPPSKVEAASTPKPKAMDVDNNPPQVASSAPPPPPPPGGATSSVLQTGGSFGSYPVYVSSGGGGGPPSGSSSVAMTAKKPPMKIAPQVNQTQAPSAPPPPPPQGPSSSGENLRPSPSRQPTSPLQTSTQPPLYFEPLDVSTNIAYPDIHMQRSYGNPFVSNDFYKNMDFASKAMSINRPLVKQLAHQGRTSKEKVFMEKSLHLVDGSKFYNMKKHKPYG